MGKAKPSGGGKASATASSKALLGGLAVAAIAVCYALFFSGAPSTPAEGSWATAQLLQALERALWAASVGDVAAATASEAAAVAALSAAEEVFSPDSWSGISPALLQVAQLAQTEMRLRLLFATLSCLDKLSLGGSNVEMQHMVAGAYKQAYPLLVGESEVLMAEQANWRQLERAARLAPPAPPGTPGGDVPKGEARAASLLTSSSFWDGGALTIVRAMHQQPAGAEHWQRLGWGIEACASLNATAVLGEFEASVVHRRGPVVDLIHSCIADAEVVGRAVGRGAKVGVANRHGWTPLHHVALLGPRDPEQRLLTQLLDAGAQPTDKNGLGHTPLHVAAYRGAPEVVAKLLAVAPALLNDRDRFGRSPADLACLHKPALAASLAAAQEYAEDDWMGEVYAALLSAGAEPCTLPDQGQEGEAAAAGAAAVAGEDTASASASEQTQTTKKKQNKKNKKKLSKKAQKALRALEWKPTQWGPSASLPEGIAPDHCDLDVIEDGSLSSDDFLQHYISVNRPVIIRQADLAGSPISRNAGQTVTREDSLKPWCGARSAEENERLPFGRHFCSFIYRSTIILPRQTRDRHQIKVEREQGVVIFCGSRQDDQGFAITIRWLSNGGGEYSICGVV